MKSHCFDFVFGDTKKARFSEINKVERDTALSGLAGKAVQRPCGAHLERCEAIGTRIYPTRCPPASSGIVPRTIQATGKYRSGIILVVDLFTKATIHNRWGANEKGRRLENRRVQG